MSKITREEAIESYKCSNKQAKIRLEVEKMRMDIGEIKELEFYIERDEMAIQALEKENIYDDKEHYVTISKALYDKLNMDYEALSQEPCTDAVSRQAVFDETIRKNSIWNSITNSEGKNLEEIIFELPSVNPQPCDDAISRDFQIGDEVRIIGSDPIYDDCDVGWVIRNASEKVKTMYVMRNDGSADEEAKAEWYRTGRHNAVLAEVIKALPSVTHKSGKWINGVCDNCKYDWGKDAPIASVPNYCPSCGACMREGRTLDEFIEDSKESEDKDADSN